MTITPPPKPDAVPKNENFSSLLDDRFHEINYIGSHYRFPVSRCAAARSDPPSISIRFEPWKRTTSSVEVRNISLFLVEDVAHRALHQIGEARMPFRRSVLASVASGKPALARVF
jgi:hypothetical protein